MSTSKKIVLRSYEEDLFEISVAVAEKSQTLKCMIEDGFADDTIPVQNVTSKIMAMVIEYCKRHAEFEALEKKTPNSDVSVEKSELDSFDSDFVKVDQATLFDLIMAANYLEIKGLLDLSCQAVADMIKGKSPDEIRKIFHIVNDFTGEEELQVRQENEWAFK